LADYNFGSSSFLESAVFHGYFYSCF